MEKALEKERYSFSKLTSFLNCRFGYFKRYVERQKGEGNAFSSYGTLIHSLMEKYAKNELELWDLPTAYELKFDVDIPEKFPPMPKQHQKYGYDMRQLYYDQGLTFLNNFQGYSEIKILEVETEFDFEIDDWIFTGVIDLVYEDSDGRIYVKDYKSKNKFKSKKEKEEKAKQLYLYALYVKQRYGRYPYQLLFEMVRSHEKEKPIPFNIEDLDKTVKWAKDTVGEIRSCFEFYPTCEEFFGNNLCNHRSDCEFRIEPKQKRRIK